jgi:hypothetical protein
MNAGRIGNIEGLGKSLDAEVAPGIGRHLIQLRLTSCAERQIGAFRGKRHCSGFPDP